MAAECYFLSIVALKVLGARTSLATHVCCSELTWGTATLQGYLSIAYSATYYELAQRHPDVPRMTEKQKEAVRWFNSLAKSDELRMDGDLQPGDIQLLQNHGVLHMRTAFEDSLVSGV